MSERMTAEQAQNRITGKVFDDIMTFVKEDFSGDTGQAAPPLRTWDELDPMEQQMVMLAVLPLVTPLVKVAVLPKVEL